MEVLVADNDCSHADLVAEVLASAGYASLHAHDGSSALQMIAERQPDIALLEVKLPKINGFDLCRRVRRTNDLPIIFLSECSDVRDRVRGLSLGGDDYIVKPFEPEELLVRIQAVLRRCQRTTRDKVSPLVCGDLVLVPHDYSVSFRGKVIELTPIEFQILHYLMANPGKVISIDEIVAHVWGEQRESKDHSLVTTYISRLRAKIPANNIYSRRIVTIRNAGYKFMIQL